MEIIVNPYTGRWYTVGDRGAEFVNVPKGSIVFNNAQTESLLANGHIGSRALALASGSALVGGGGISTTALQAAKKVQASNAKSSSSSSKTSSTKSSSTSSSKTSSSNKSSTSTEKDPQAIDWIEIAINRLERAITNLKNTASSAYKSLKTKLGATASEISNVTKEIALQQQAYDKYIQKANGVGLSSSLAEKVRNGTVDVTKYDSNTAEKIKEYQGFYENALKCSDAIQQLHENLASLYADNFNNIQDDYKNQLSLLEHMTKTYESGIKELKTRGYLESTKYYQELSNVEKQNIEVLNKELADLTSSFSQAMNSGEIEEYSDSWYSMQNSINDVKESIDEANISLLEYQKTMREIEWGYFDYTEERISQLTSEADFLIDLMSEAKLHQDNGQLTNEGLSTMGLHGQNYNVYMAQADQYGAELLKINEELAKDPYNTELIERKEKLLELQQKSILAAEKEKKAMIDLVESGIKLELDSLKELIDLYTDSLDSAKDLYDYQKKIKSQTEEIATLEKTLGAYKNDTSEEARAKIQKITVELENANQELQETEYEKMVSDTKKLLDEMYQEYSDTLNQRLDNIDFLIGDMIATINLSSDSIGNTLTTVSENVGYTMTSEMQTIWKEATDSLSGVVSTYSDNFGGQLTSINSVLNSIQANTSAMVKESNAKATATTSTTKPTTTPATNASANKTTTTSTTSTKTTATKAISVGGTINAKGAKIYDYVGAKAEMQDFANDPIYKVLDEKNGWLQVRWHKLSSGVTGWFKKSDVKAYKTGGLVDYTGLAQLDGTRSKPEIVLNPEDSKNFMELRDVLRSMALQPLTYGNSYNMTNAPALTGIIDFSKIGSFEGANVNLSNNITFGDINIDHVENYKDFVNQLKEDKKFEKMIQAITVDQLTGGSSLAKNKYRW